MIKVDKLMVNRYQIPIELMMEHAGFNLARLVLKLSNTSIDSYNIIAGSGNNGGGGMVAARRLKSWGFKVNIYLPRGKSNLNVTSQMQLKRIHEIDINVTEGLPIYESSNIIFIDAYLGYNFRNRKDVITEKVFSFLRESKNIISLDIPSGLDANTGENYSNFNPLATLTLAFVKKGLVISDKKAIGELFIADIGVPIEIYKYLLNINWKSPYNLKSLNKLYSAFNLDSLQRVKIVESDKEKFWEIF